MTTTLKSIDIFQLNLYLAMIYVNFSNTIKLTMHGKPYQHKVE
jgi:hypothetical protein